MNSKFLPVRIKTISPNSVPLKISILDVNSHFVVKELEKESVKQGTEITIITNENKFQKDNGKLREDSFPFTAYLNNIAGFVEFPIIITERNCKVIIIHPNYSNRSILKEKELQNIRKVNFKYPINGFFLPHYCDDAKKFFSETIINLKSNLSLKDYEGAISFLDIPNNYEWKSQRNPNYFGSGERNNLSLVNLEDLKDKFTFQVFDVSNYHYFKDDFKEKKWKFKKSFLCYF